MEQSVHRYRIQFSKHDPLRFIGHLDLHRTWERVLRRARIPLAFTQGIHPRIRLNIGQALPLGCSSDGDLMDIWLTGAEDASDLQLLISGKLPQGLAIESMQSVKYSEPALQKLIQSAHFLAGLPTDIDLDSLQQRVERLLQAQSVIRSRRGKSYDLRPLVASLTLDRKTGKLEMQLSALEGATGRADEVLRELEIDPAEVLIHRTKLSLQEN